MRQDYHRFTVTLFSLRVWANYQYWNVNEQPVSSTEQLVWKLIAMTSNSFTFWKWSHGKSSRHNDCLILPFQFHQQRSSFIQHISGMSSTRINLCCISDVNATWALDIIHWERIYMVIIYNHKYLRVVNSWCWSL